MTLEKAKEEMVKRYKYLYENAYFILAPFMYEQTKEEFEESKKNYDFKAPLIYLKLNRDNCLIPLFEQFLLSDKNMEESALYKLIESKRNDKEYLEQVKKGLALLEKENATRSICKECLDIWNILRKVCDYIDEQSSDLKNKENKLYVLDQYYRILRYRNDGKIYTSGRRLDLHDCTSISVPLHKRQPSRDKNDIGVVKNSFISAIFNAPYYEDNWSIFTESEKQQIYLDYHDELPCDLEITCDIEEEYIKTMIETRLVRPDNTNPCEKNFVVKEDEIFVDPNDTLYRYYQLCPHCGFIVNIPKEILSEGIKQRIEERCSKDDKLFRKMFLYSELFSLDNVSTKDQKKLLKK